MLFTCRLCSRQLVPSLLLAFSLLLVPVAPGLATTFYVDSVGGSDGTSGLTPETAWRTLAKANATTFAPGDTVLFKAGCAWSGQLWPKGSGAEGAPITVASYGAGAKPIINGNGAAQEALLLHNQQYWEIGHLEITNYDPAGPDVDPYRQGIRVLGEDAGTLRHIYLRDLDVHDVNGSITVGRDQGKCNAGILFDVEGTTAPTSFDDVLIEGCNVHDCERSGIKLWSNWGRSCDQADPALHTNVIIRSNVVDSIAGDGINVHQTAGALAEYNLVSRSCYRTDKANAALWTWASDDAIIQYNEVYQSMQTRDGMAFDIDGCSQRCIFQYNYSHDNQGGFVMVIGVPDCVGGGPYSKFCNDNHFRYNISQNDRTRIYRLVGKMWDNYIYNNVAYLDDTNPDWVEGLYCGSPAQWADHTYFWNNVFYNTNSDAADFRLGASANTVFDYNLFYGNHPAGEPADPHKLTSDPKFVSPGSAGVGRDTCDGYKLLPGSPCIDSGMAIAANGGRDFWGVAVPWGATADRGASEAGGFPDVPSDHWAYDEIMACVAARVVAGYPDGYYRPDNEVTRDQMAVYVARALVSPSGDAAIPDPEPPPSFSDVPPDHWAYKHIEYAVRQNVVEGYDDGTYLPGMTVDRGQMAVYVARAMVAPGGDAAIPDPVPPATFPDVPDTFWAYKQVEYCVGQGVVKGYDDGLYHPEIVVTRDQMAVFVARAFELPM